MINLKLLNHYLNMEIIHSFNHINLNQIFYLLKILKRFEMTYNKSMNIFMKSNIFNVMMLFDDDYKIDNDIIYWYFSMIKSLMYAMIMTWSNLIYFFLILSRYCFNPNLTHVKIIIRVFKYIKRTLDYDIHYENKENLIKYIDVDFAKTVNNCCLIDDYAFFFVKRFYFMKFKTSEFDHSVKLRIRVCCFQWNR